jgi:hypothetical protein
MSPWPIAFDALGAGEWTLDRSREKRRRSGLQKPMRERARRAVVLVRD